MRPDAAVAARRCRGARRDELAGRRVEVDGPERPALVGGRVERVLLEGQERPRHGPALALPAEQVGVRHQGAVEVHEVELRAPVHLLDRAGLDAGLLRRAQEEREPAVLRRVPVRAGEEHAVRDDLGVARPDLGAVDAPLVAVADGRGPRSGEVGPGVRLGQHLARGLTAVRHAAQEAVALLIGAVAEQHRGQQRGTDARRRTERPDGAALGAHELGDRDRQPLAAPALRPRRIAPPAVVHQPEPRADRQRPDPTTPGTRLVLRQRSDPHPSRSPRPADCVLR